MTASDILLKNAQKRKTKFRVADNHLFKFCVLYHTHTLRDFEFFE